MNMDFDNDICYPQIQQWPHDKCANLDIDQRPFRRDLFEL